MKTAMVLMTLALSCFAQSATAQGNLVVNGDFNAGTTGWTLTNGAGYDSKSGDPVPCLQFVNTNLPANPTASQTINSLNPGSLYAISGDYACLRINTTNIRFEVLLDGVSFFQAAALTNSSWNSFNFEYTATSPSAVLSLSVQINGIGLFNADNISMILIPEPNTLCLVGLSGIAGAAFFRSRRKN